MIYTSYFAQLRNLPKDIIPICISLGIPAWFKGKSYEKLMPAINLDKDFNIISIKSNSDKWTFLKQYKNGNISEEKYVEIYKNAILNKLDINDVIKELYSISNGMDVALVCYEGYETFCHRHIDAKWFNENGIECKEWRNISI